MHEPRSHKVRTILQLEGRAAAWRARYEGTLARIAPARHKSEQLRQQAVAVKVTLTARELAELRCARSGV